MKIYLPKAFVRYNLFMKLLNVISFIWNYNLNWKESNPVPSLDECLNDLFREEQCLLTQDTMDQHKSTSVPVVYAIQAKPKGWDMSAIQCFCCKEFGHYAFNCPKKFCSYCKKDGHIIKERPILWFQISLTPPLKLFSLIGEGSSDLSPSNF